jgi:N-acetylmuramoyl-L-alanine amidase
MPLAQVVIDPGHGGRRKIGGSSENNAKGPTGLLEKTVTLQVGRKARDSLMRHGMSVLLTRNTDVNHGLAYRASVAKSARANAFVSIHFNDDKKPATQGTETWVHTNSKNPTSPSMKLARLIQRTLLQVTGYRNRHVQDKNLGVLNPARHLKTTAACLVEISFISDPAEEARLKESAYRASLGAAIAEGIQQYLSRREKNAPAIAGTRGQLVFEDATSVA